ncbi:MAG: DUF3634 family protein [Gammaproteobacteria bacterium]|nr:DUF3634 family protein [Gammaproteobacteria bacterium]
MNNIYIVVGLFIAIVVIGYLKRPSEKEFVIKVKYRAAKLVKGSAPDNFVTECKEVAKIHKTIKGNVFGIRKDGGIKLEFSKSITEAEKQIFRNVWPNAYLDGNPPPESGTRKMVKRL